jgi:hypothetical protein
MTRIFQSNLENVIGDMLEIFTQTFEDNKLTEDQKRGVTVCTQKTTRPTHPMDFRPISLLNTDLKILDRIIASRLRPILIELLHPSKYCGLPGNTILEAVATVRVAIDFVEATLRPLCVLSLDFKEAFDRILYTYFFTILMIDGFSDGFVERMKHMYGNATSLVQINWLISGAIPIGCSVRQGCPLSLMLFASRLNPLIHRLEQTLQVSGYYGGNT